MKISGFTFIKNGITLGYPIKESIETIAPLCDEVIINVGFDDPHLEQDDGTYQLLTSHFTDKKFIFLKSFWNPQLKAGGLILSEQTNIALKKCRGDFCIYIQGDEAIHEDDHKAIRQGIAEMERDESIDGLLFNYLHFYGNVNIIKETRNTYRREIRVIRNHRNIKSWLDAQGFRHQDNSKLKVIPIQSRIFHYGWARNSFIMDKKVKSFGKLYHGEAHQEKAHFSYKRIWGLKKFTGTHPQLLGNWINNHRNDVELLQMKRDYSIKDLNLMVSDFIEQLTGYRMFEYKNFKIKRKYF